MLFHIGLENNVEGRSIAWVLGYPGCFAYGQDGEAALKATPAAISSYGNWIASHKEEGWFSSQDPEIQLDETWECYSIDENYELAADGYEVNAWFRHDWKPLTEEDIERGLLLLTWCRDDLLLSVRNLSQEVLERKYPGGRWNIAGILKHIGGADWWYLDRLGLAFPREQVPGEPFARLETTRSHLLAKLPGLVGLKHVLGSDGEIWSPRKLLRRAVWHEHDHTNHIQKLLGNL